MVRIRWSPVQLFGWRTALLLGLLVLNGCAATYKRAESVEFVTEGEAAVAASRAYYGNVIERQNGLIRLIYRQNPECPLDYTIKVRRLAPKQLGAMTGECQKLYRAAKSFCLTQEMTACQQGLDIATQRGLSVELQTKPMSTSDFAPALGLIGIISEYLDAIAKYARADASRETFDARLGSLIPRINAFACQVNALNSDGPAPACTMESAAAILSAPQQASLNAAAKLADMIAQLRDDARSAEQIFEILKAKGPAFDQALSELMLDMEDTRKVYLASATLIRLDVIKQVWAMHSVELKLEQRDALLDQWLEAHVAMNQYLESPASPIKLLEKLRKSHLELNNLFNGQLSPEQREEQAEVMAQQLADFYKLSFAFVRSLGIL